MKKTPKKASPWPIGDLSERMNDVKIEIKRVEELVGIALDERDHLRYKLQNFARWGFEDEETIAEFNKGMANYKEKYGEDLDFSELRNDKLGCIAWLNERYTDVNLLESGIHDHMIKSPADRIL